MLFESFRDEAQGRAKRFARKYSLDEANVESELMWTMQTCLDNFDESRGVPFEAFLRNAWSTAQQNVLRDTYSSAYVRNVDGDESALDDQATEDDAIAELTIDDYKRRVANSVDDGETLCRVMDMLAAGGYTHAQIAYACGFEGSDAAAKMWTARAIERIRRAWFVPGDKVAIVDGPMKGEKGVVVRRVEGDNGDFTHVVRLARTGEKLAFKASEMEVQA